MKIIPITILCLTLTSFAYAGYSECRNLLTAVDLRIKNASGWARTCKSNNIELYMDYYVDPDKLCSCIEEAKVELRGETFRVKMKKIEKRSQK